MAKKKAQAGDGKKITKMAAVRQTLAEGIDKASEAMPHIKTKFGLDINEATFNNYKSVIKHKGEKRKKRRMKMAAAPAVGKVGGKAGNPLEAAQAVKQLVDKYGAETVKGLADLLG